MAKFNWNRVRTEKDISRYGSEYVKKEREIYFRGKGTDTSSFHQHNTSPPQDDVSSASPTTVVNSEKYLVCPHCEVKFVKDKLQQHISKAHQTITEPLSQSNQPTKPQSREIENTNSVEIKVGDSKDGRIRLPATMFSGKSGKAIINGIIYLGNPGDAGRCKLPASIFGARPGQTIRLTRQTGDVWTVTIDGKAMPSGQTSKSNVANSSVILPNKKPEKILVSSPPSKVEPKRAELKKQMKSIVNDISRFEIYSRTPFSDKDLRDWFFDSFSPDVPTVDRISTTGSAPFDEDDLDLFFKKKSITVCAVEAATEILVIGRDDWDEEDLMELLDKRAGKQLRVYSQEMFLLYWMSGCDPLGDREIALKFAEGHPALEFLLNAGFDWVNTYVGIGDGDLEFNKELPTVGVLRHLGYKVGISGLFDMERQQILRYVFNSELPVVVSNEYMKEWGKPKSKERLLKMANSLAAFCRNEKRKSNPSKIAIKEWEVDLEWLKDTFYTGRFTFQYPSTY